MVLLDHGGRHPSEVELMPPPSDLQWLVEHIWVQASLGETPTAWRARGSAVSFKTASRD